MGGGGEVQYGLCGPRGVQSWTALFRNSRLRPLQLMLLKLILTQDK